jgi:hypothetical protein
MTSATAALAETLLELPDAPPRVRNAVGAELLHALGLAGRQLEPLSLADLELMAALGLIPNPPEEG